MPYRDRPGRRVVVDDRNCDEPRAILGSAWSDTQAAGINQVGDIVRYGFFEGGQSGFLLTPASTTAVSATLFSTAPGVAPL
jgi:hypothetical protein